MNRAIIAPLVAAIAAILSQFYNIVVDEVVVEAWITALLSIGGFVGIFMKFKNDKKDSR